MKNPSRLGSLAALPFGKKDGLKAIGARVIAALGLLYRNKRVGENNRRRHWAYKRRLISARATQRGVVTVPS